MEHMTKTPAIATKNQLQIWVNSSRWREISEFFSVCPQWKIIALIYIALTWSPVTYWSVNNSIISWPSFINAFSILRIVYLDNFMHVNWIIFFLLNYRFNRKLLIIVWIMFYETLPLYSGPRVYLKSSFV